MFCLDTNIVIGVMTGRAPGVAARLESELSARTPLLIPAMVLFELRFGALKSAFLERNLARLADFLAAMSDILVFDTEDSAAAADIRTHLQRRGTPIGPYDILIAAQTRRRRAALVTNNRTEFERVPGLIVTDWAT